MNSKERRSARKNALDIIVSNLGMLTVDDLAICLSTTRQNVQMLIDVGCIASIKIGSANLISLEEFESFQRKFKGMDLSNKLEMIQAKKLVDMAGKS